MKYVVTLNGKDYEVEVDELSEAIVTSVAPTAASAPAAPVAAQPSAPATPAPAPVSESGTAVKAPMPGTILKVNVTAGQSVKAGDIMFIYLFLTATFNIIYANTSTTTEQHRTAYIASILTHLSKKYKLQSILSLNTVTNSFGIPISDSSLKTPFKA